MNITATGGKIMNNIMVNEMRLCDELGRERIFNGINLVHKGIDNADKSAKTYNPEWTEETIAGLAKRGFNIVRLGLIWEAIEPECGVFCEEYLAKMEGYADLLGKYGIYFLLDFHQDLYSARYSDGAPDWATVSDSYKFHEPKIIWAEGYFLSKAVHRACDNFWDNTKVNGKGLQEHYCDMLKYTVQRFCQKPGYLGVDIMNEPFPGTAGGTIFRKIVGGAVYTVLFSGKIKKVDTLKKMIKGDAVPEALSVIDGDVMDSVTRSSEPLVREFDTKKYYPFLKKAAAAVREVTDNGCVIMENCYYSNIGIPCFTPVIKYDNGEREKNLVFAPHAYGLTVDSSYTNTSNDATVDYFFGQHRDTQERLEVPVIVGEWGGMVPGSDDYPNLEYLLDLFDKNHWSQTYWTYSERLKDSKIMDILARPYPQAVAGKIISYGFDRKAGKFTLEYQSDSSCGGLTEIFLPREPVSVQTTAEYSVDSNENGTFTLKAGAADGKIVIEVEI